MDDRAQPDLVKDLLRPQGTMLAETHISWVFLRGCDVWKVKKPVDFGFLDFSSPEKRREACEAEVRLNQRLAPRVYRGIVPITRSADGRYDLDGSGEPVDWAVHMARLPETERADHRLTAGRLEPRHLRWIAERLAGFHRRARCDEVTTRYGRVDAVGGNVRENFDQTRDLLHLYLDAEQAEEIETWQTRFLEEHAERFEARCAAGRVRDGHGDLRLEHVYLFDDGRTETPGLACEDRVVIVDCIEFNRRFRFADVCADVAFLAMDLAWHGHADDAERFLAAYARAADDFDLYPLVDFYESYRAFVRGKIAALVSADPSFESAARDRFAHEARRYFLLALASERRALRPPRLIAVGGIIACGKSTVADRLARELAAPGVDADRTRKAMLGVSPEQPVHDRPFQGAYTPAATEAVYDEVLRRAGVILSTGRTVILDASFRSPEMRLAARDLARRHDVPFLFVECRAAPDLCRHRLEQRAEEGGVSDGRLEIFDDFVASWKPVDELPERQHLVLDTSRPLEANLETLRRRLDGG